MEAGEEEILEVVVMVEEDFLEVAETEGDLGEVMEVEGEMEGVVEAVVVVEGEKLNKNRISIKTVLDFLLMYYLLS